MNILLVTVPISGFGWAFFIGLLLFIIIYVLLRLLTEHLEHSREEKNQKKK